MPPLVLVGYQPSGLYDRLYANRYRSDVAGMVLVDPGETDRIARLTAIAPGARTDVWMFAGIPAYDRRCYAAAVDGMRAPARKHLRIASPNPTRPSACCARPQAVGAARYLGRLSFRRPLDPDRVKNRLTDFARATPLRRSAADRPHLGYRRARASDPPRPIAGADGGTRTVAASDRGALHARGKLRGSGFERLDRDRRSAPRRLGNRRSQRPAAK